jgi:hypothetical protein
VLTTWRWVVLVKTCRRACRRAGAGAGRRFARCLSCSCVGAAQGLGHICGHAQAKRLPDGCHVPFTPRPRPRTAAHRTFSGHSRTSADAEDRSHHSRCIQPPPRTCTRRPPVKHPPAATIPADSAPCGRAFLALHCIRVALCAARPSPQHSTLTCSSPHSSTCPEQLPGRFAPHRHYRPRTHHHHRHRFMGTAPC